ncbi:thermonuclease family protein [Nocardioides sp. PD653-B2]|uniref:thermonuclease family protein n=1 Tax=Nocardioides sp. PD653-B2 TaxID=1892811 RepID=UPI0039C8D796
MEAPEVAHPPEPAECYAEDATGLPERLAPVGSTVGLGTDTAQPNRDRYDRLLRYVDHDDVDVAREPLAGGAARRYEADRRSAAKSRFRGRRRCPGR